MKNYLIEKYLGEVDYNKIAKNAEKLHAKAKGQSGNFKFNGKTYHIEFENGVFVISGPDLENEGGKIQYNTRKMAQAKKWFKEHMES